MKSIVATVADRTNIAAKDTSTRTAKGRRTLCEYSFVAHKPAIHFYAARYVESDVLVSGCGGIVSAVLYPYLVAVGSEGKRGL